MDGYRVEKWNQPTAPNPAMLRYLLELDGFRVFQWRDNPGMAYGSHKHDEDQSHWIVSGALELTIERLGTFVLETGDRDFLPAGTYHSARVVVEDPVMYLVGAK
jgi:quercetin dioxygenase-like cupin family protein